MKKSLKKLSLNVKTVNALKQAEVKGGATQGCPTNWFKCSLIVCSLEVPHEVKTMNCPVSDECTNPSYVPAEDHYVC